MSLLIPVILCGGSGTRLWPLSRETEPKQFLRLTGGPHSLLQDTALRLNGLAQLVPNARVAPAPILVTHQDTRFLVAGQLQEAGIPTGQIVLEPTGRNTAPALTLAALQALASQPGLDPVLLAMPADHVVTDQAAFIAAVAGALPAAADGAVVTFGIVPDRAETGYGYIQYQASANPPTHGGQAPISPIQAFVEKPDAATALRYVQGGQHLWNSGLFMLKASAWIKALGHYRPDILTACQQAMAQAQTDQDFVRPHADTFKACPSESIDYAVMEHLPNNTELGIPSLVVPLQAGWNDVGAWDALHGVLPKDTHGNASVGETILHNTQNSFVFASNRLVAAAGLNHIGIVETADAVLVVDLRQTQDVKNIVTRLKTEGHHMANTHRKVHRPWGWYDGLDSGERFQVKRIQVKPGASLSLQLHHHRAEHWIVVKGTAEIVNGDQVLTLTENQSTYIPIGQKHRLSNRGTEPLEIIEVQSGSYLGEDDIVRFEDTFGRVG
ncbi:mannose-1-phosphate guanylyltransferase/mannose-6-phosphate isomerase [Limnohabitans sp.]|uniref:mannose-1-phosphate guanylyltransferase/mannose-6-phosphate isomerase n=1 Tax=Limnohabitans sp. TaxID=1907725 RepID=UPI0031FC419C